jgi:hypothetical protein
MCPSFLFIRMILLKFMPLNELMLYRQLQTRTRTNLLEAKYFKIQVKNW